MLSTEYQASASARHAMAEAMSFRSIARLVEPSAKGPQNSTSLSLHALLVPVEYLAL